MSDPTDPDPVLDIVLLAAGLSRRFGSSKLLAPLFGRTVLEVVVGELLDLPASRLVVVVGPGFPADLPGLGHPAVVLTTNAEPAMGLSSSLRAGLRGVRPESEAVMLCLADQAALRTADYRRLIDRWRTEPQRPAAAFYRSRLGAPAILPRAWFDELRALEGDRGAAGLLRDRPGDVTAVDLPTAAVDIDTPADLARCRDLAGG